MKVTVITKCQCIQSNGDGSTWSQEKALMRGRQSKPSPCPQWQLIKGLTAFVKEKQCLKCDIVLSFDANKVAGEALAGASKLICGCRLFDLLSAPGAEPDEQLKGAFNSRRVDYVLGSQRVWEHAQRCGALEHDDGIMSDHHGLRTDLGSAQLSAHDPAPAPSRSFTSKSANKVHDYLDDLEKCTMDHRVKEQARVLSFAMPLPHLGRASSSHAKPLTTI